MMHEPIYTTNQVAKITGFSLRQLDYWARQMMITPSFQQAKGSGSQRLYTNEDLVQLNIVRQLKKYHWSTQKIRKAIETLKEIISDTNPLRNAILIHGKGTIFALSKTKTGERLLIDALSTTGQQVMSFVLETLLEEVRNMASTSDIHKLSFIDGSDIEVAHAGGQEPCR